MYDTLCLSTTVEQNYSRAEIQVAPTARERLGQVNDPVFQLDGYDECLRARNDHALDIIRLYDRQGVVQLTTSDGQTLNLKVDGPRSKLRWMDEPTRQYIRNGDLEEVVINTSDEIPLH